MKPGLNRKTLVFGRSFWIGCMGLIVLGFLFGAFFWNQGFVDRVGYQKLIRSVDPSLSEPAPHKSRHQRKEVIKEVILSKDASGRRAHLEGKEAAVVLDRHREGTDVLEYLYEVEGSITDQNEEYRLVADKLCCDYPQDTFSASSAKLSKWLHQDSITPVLRAFAPMAKLHLRSDTITLSGGATLENNKGSAFAQEVIMDPQKIVLKEHVTFEDKIGMVEADHCTIDLAEGSQSMERIFLEGNIRLQNRLSHAMQYALADRVDYDPVSGEMLLYSDDHGRVLFFDQGEDYQMSAKALRILRKKGELGNTVQGLGDVRFQFADHEKEKIKKRFGL